MEQKELWIALALSLGPRSYYFRSLISHFKTPEAIFSASEQEICEVAKGIGRGTLASLAGNTHKKEAAAILRWCSRNHIIVLTYADEVYPERLREISEPAIVLYCRGDLDLLKSGMSLAVIGKREPDAYGAAVGYKLSFELACAGVTLVSGMADGIDGLASAAALEAGGKTVAVLGCGIDVVYPRHHGKLAAQIASSGLLVTEYPPGTPPYGRHFPMRNRLISALGAALLVVEAGNPSGTLITARYAILQGKTIFAVPGDINKERSIGTNSLIRDGAFAVFEANDILSHFRFLYRDAVNERAFFEAMQYSELGIGALRKYGLRIESIEKAMQAELPSKREEKEQKKAQKRAEKREKLPKEPAEEVYTPDPAEKEASLALLDDRQRQIYALLPTEAFSLDALAAESIPTGEAAATLTVLEIYGLVRSFPGGLYQKM